MSEIVAWETVIRYTGTVEQSGELHTAAMKLGQEKGADPDVVSGWTMTQEKADAERTV